jgi:hypothetical protein
MLDAMTGRETQKKWLTGDSATYQLSPGCGGVGNLMQWDFEPSIYCTVLLVRHVYHIHVMGFLVK